MVVLGSTGSIGVNTLEIAKKFNLKIEALVAGNNYKLLNKQIKEFTPKYVVVKNKEIAKKVNFKNVTYSEEAILEVIEKSSSKIVVNALVGDAGLKPTLKAIECNKKLALANKESLVNAGKLIDTKNIIPIDSEHFGLWYLLRGKKNYKKLLITASGGALRDFNDVTKASLKDVLNHPNWSMGAKITIDSATMVNKLFELIEARWLFNTTNIDSFIETKSIIHALVEWIDGSTTIHMSKPDMKLPIAFAILNELNEEIVKPVNLLEVKSLEFREIDIKKYPIWEIKDLILNNPDLAVVLNSANEVATALFLKEKISFLDITKLIFSALKKFENININSLKELFEIKNEIKEWCDNFI